MAKEEMIPILKLVGATEWLNAGYKGQGVRVWNCEDLTSHGKNTRQMILDVAPECEIKTGSINMSFNSEQFSKPPTVNGIGVKQFVKENNFQIISSSIRTWSVNKAWEKYVSDLETDALILNLSGNEGSDEPETIASLFPAKYCTLIGALNFVNGKFTRASYSSIGNELDFVQSVGWWSGTSASTPFQAGMCAIIMSRYGRMSMQEMYKYLQMISKDLGEKGHDTYHGWGQPILPPLSKKYITMTTTSNKYKVDGKEYEMDTRPVNNQGNVFVPIRAISEALGANVEWSFNSNNSIKVVIDGRIELNTDLNFALIDGKKQYLNFPPYIDTNNRTMVPIRFIAEALNCKVDWVQSESKVMILEV